MPSNPDTAGTRRPHLEFDDVVVDADNYRVYKRGELRAIGPRAFDLLLYLMAHPHRVVSKDELFDRVWQGVAVTDNALTRAVKDLRRAVGDDARSPKYVETASRRGYRFVAPMREVPASTRVSLLVLPFDDLSEAPEAYLTEGLTEELIAQLGRANPDRLSVIARTSAMSAAAGGKPWAEMARDLDVDHIVRGSVRRDDRRVQVTVHLARLPAEDPQWSETFEADAPGLLEVQQRLAAAIAGHVQVQLVHDAGAPATLTVDPAAHAALLEGRYFLQKRTADSVRNALAAFEGAVAREPDLARAHVGLAHCHAFHLMGHGSKAEALARARAAVDRALALDDRLAEAHTMRAVLQCADWQFAAAERSFRWAIALDPNAPGARHWLAMFPLVASGRFEEALAELRRARRLDPLSLIISADIAGVYCMTRQFERAVMQSTESLHLEPAFARAHVYLGWARVGLGRHDAAVVALETAARLDATPWTRAWLGHAYGAAGRAADAREILRGFLEGPDANRGESPFFAGVVAAGLGDADQALASFERAVDLRSLWVATLAALPPLDGLRGDRRFDGLLQRIREAAWPGGAGGS